MEERFSYSLVNENRGKTAKIAEKSRKMHRSARACAVLRIAPSSGSNHLLLEDLLHGHGGLLRPFLIVSAQAVAAGVTHDRIRGDHRAAGGTGDFRLAPGDRLSRHGWLCHDLRALNLGGLGGRHRFWPGRLGVHWDRLWSNSRWRDCGRDHDATCGGRRCDRGGRADRSHRLLLRDYLLLLLEESLTLLSNFRPGCRNRFLLCSKPLLPVHEFAISIDLRLKRRLLFLEELDDLLLPSRDLTLAGRDLPHVGDRLRVSVHTVLFALHERVEPLHDFLFPTHELILFRQDVLFRCTEFLFPLVDGAFLLFEFLFTSTTALLTADEGISFLRESGPFLLHHPAVFFQLRALVLD